MSDQFKAASELMREMGSPRGEFDPMPPSQHEFFLDIGESETSRAIAWAWSKTIRRHGRRRVRSAFCRDERGDLSYKHLAADLGMHPIRAHTVLDRLDEQGRIRRDEDGRIYLAGDVPEPRRTKGEEKENPPLYKTIDNDYLLYLQSLEKSVRDNALAADLGVEVWQDQLEREAVAWARAFARDYRERVRASYGYANGKGLGGRPPVKLEQTGVRLELKAEPDLTAFVQMGIPVLREMQNGVVQTAASLLVSESESDRVSVSESAAQYTTPPTTPPTSKPDQEQLDPERWNDPDPVLNFVQHYFQRQIGSADPLRRRFANLVGRHGVPADSICRYLSWFTHKKRERGYTIESPGALLKFCEKDLAGWLAQHKREVEQDIAWQERREKELAAEVAAAAAKKRLR